MSKPKRIWTDEQVVTLNARQHRSDLHPYTCGGNRTDEKHLDGEGVLVATPYGWVCPYCSYRQGWAHDADVAGELPLPIPALRKMEALHAEIARLRAALAPFAEYARRWPDVVLDSSVMDYLTPNGPTMGDCRRAKEALEGKP